MVDLVKARKALADMTEALADDTAAPSPVLGVATTDPDEHEIKVPLGAKVNLAVIVGHDANRKGAWSPVIGSEWDFHQVQAARIVKASAGTGCRVKVFLRDPASGSISEVARRVNRWAQENRDHQTLAVSLHFNSFRTAQANGTETLHASSSVPGEKWAGMLQRCMLNCFGLKNRGLLPVKRGGRGGTILYSTSMPCALLEPGFGSNERDAKTMEEHWPVFAEDLIAAALAFGS